MGYELHITKIKNQSRVDQDISAMEWLELVESDPELELFPENGEYFTIYLGECKYGKGEGWFDWSDGRIFSKNPDNLLLAKMLRISKLLNASVQGDDGEFYYKADINSGIDESVEEEKVIKDIFWYLAIFNDFRRNLIKKWFGNK